LKKDNQVKMATDLANQQAGGSQPLDLAEQ